MTLLPPTKPNIPQGMNWDFLRPRPPSKALNLIAQGTNQVSRMSQMKLPGMALRLLLRLLLGG
jgi:hypothetical protein